MMFTIEEIARATGGVIFGETADGVIAVSTDSRTVRAGELFVALAGERFDGHDFIQVALARGVKALLVNQGRFSRDAIPAGATVVSVENTLRALGDLAAFHRRRFAIPVAGITGSNGKTTVKEMLAAILELTGPGLKTAGNLNNLIGLPQMLFRLNGGHQWAVLEMGMSEPGEIDRLAEIAAPRVGVITNAYPAHLASMGSVEAVARAKGELFLRLPEGGCAVCNGDDPLVSRLPIPAGVQRLSFGLADAEIRGSAIESLGLDGQSFTLFLGGESLPVRLRAFGRHNVANALAAAAAAVALGVPADLIRAGLERFIPYDKRFSLEELDGIVLIDDSYNANPASMRAALTTLREIRQGRRAVAVLGDMLELGAIAAEAHREVGKIAASCVDRLYVMGEMARTVAEGAREGGLTGNEVIIAEGHEDILADLFPWISTGDCILVKGSRGMGMDKVAEGIRRHFTGDLKKGAAA
ncbi:MAG TPA: UDP-N-acetylmuramoyl-tripeptide--D-alanyl-D-alanine ligase [Geobacteraceae bacterium]|nr:UDP-N-acetylmuramoyl-tripeptide--D-alanyl-D-alanine ligase [Geobacteraceae bacterium]